MSNNYMSKYRDHQRRSHSKPRKVPLNNAERQCRYRESQKAARGEASVAAVQPTTSVTVDQPESTMNVDFADAVLVDATVSTQQIESDSGGWGPWSPWTKCTTTCSGGTRNRYRLCDSPPPRYGAKFCEGHALETERCGVALSWDCAFYQDSGGPEVPAERPEVKAEIGPGCRCGCVVHLGIAKPRRLIASSSQSCPGRTFWLVQADRNQLVRLTLEQFRLPCTAQWLKIRDGDSLSSTLLAQLSGAPSSLTSIISTGHCLLLEFFADEITATREDCWGGFLAHAQQIEKHNLNATIIRTQPVKSVPSPFSRLAIVHITIVLFLVGVLLASTCLGAQYIHRYRKYQLAAATEDIETITDCSIQGSRGSLLPVRSRATSSTTLLSEVISLRRFCSNKHTRLAEHEAEDDFEEYEDSPDDHRDDDVQEVSVRGDKEDAKVNISDSNIDSEQRPKTLEVSSQRYIKSNSDTPRIHMKHRKYKSPVSPVVEGPELSDNDDGSTPRAEQVKVHTEHLQQRRHSNGVNRPSAASSPASSLRSNNNIKESKDKRNRERLLAGSEFSLTGQDTDLEMDYYDYNVSNTSTVPGSYLGMDPAFCVWIPPFAPGRWNEDDNDEELINLSEADETELKEFTSLINKPPIIDGLVDTKSIEETTEFSDAQDDNHSGSRTPVNVTSSDVDVKSEKSFHDCYSLNKFSKSTENNKSISTDLYVDDKSYEMVPKLVPETPVKVHQAYRIKEKETLIEKSPSCESEYYDLLDNDNDIKFADDDEDDDLIVQDTDKKAENHSLLKETDNKKMTYYGKV